MAAEVGPRCECTDLADELKLAHRGLEALVPKPLHGPISCTVILGQLARIGPSSTQRTATQDCHMGPHNLQLVGWLPRLAHSADALSLPTSWGWPTEAWRPSCPSPCMGLFHAP